MGNSDLRIIKTHKVLHTTLLALLKQRCFSQITVNDLCKQAQVSRAAFYAHFSDKYDFLRFFLSSIRLNIDKTSYEETAAVINRLTYENSTIIKHLLDDMVPDTLQVILEFIPTLLGIDIKSADRGNAKYTVLLNFFAGGIINYLNWHIANRFPAEPKVVNPYLFHILKIFWEW